MSRPHPYTGTGLQPSPFRRPPSPDLLGFTEPKAKLTLIDGDGDEDEDAEPPRVPAPPPQRARATGKVTVFPTSAAIPAIDHPRPGLRAEAKEFRQLHPRTARPVIAARGFHGGQAFRPEERVVGRQDSSHGAFPAGPSARPTLVPVGSRYQGSSSQVRAPASAHPRLAPEGRSRGSLSRPPIRITRPLPSGTRRPPDPVERHIAQVEAASHLVHPQPIRRSSLVNPQEQREPGGYPIIPYRDTPSPPESPSPAKKLLYTSQHRDQHRDPSSPPALETPVCAPPRNSDRPLQKSSDLPPPSDSLSPSRVKTPPSCDLATACGQSIIPQTPGALATVFRWNYPHFPAEFADKSLFRGPVPAQKIQGRKKGAGPVERPILEEVDQNWLRDGEPFVKARLVSAKSSGQAPTPTPLGRRKVAPNGRETVAPVEADPAAAFKPQKQSGAHTTRGDPERPPEFEAIDELLDFHDDIYITDPNHFEFDDVSDTPVALDEPISDLFLDSNRPSATSPQSASPPPASYELYDRFAAMPSIRSMVPAAISNSVNALQRSMIASWKSSEPSPARIQQIQKLQRNLERALNSKWSYNNRNDPGPRFTVDLFGSASWGGETGPNGDVDLVVRDRKLPRGYSPQWWKSKSRTPNYRAPPALYKLHSMRGLIQDVCNVEPKIVPQPATPIIKFQYTDQTVPPKLRQKLDVDLCINDLGGWYNSLLIKEYCEFSPYVLRPLIHALKLWSAAQSLNYTGLAGGGMTSYCLTLMAIAFLQQRGALPNLQENVVAPEIDEPEVADDEWTVWVSWGKPVGAKAHVQFIQGGLPGWRPKDPKYTAAEALKDFFDYYRPSNPLSPLVTRQAISPLHGGVLERVKTTPTQTEIWGGPRPLSPRQVKTLYRMGKGDRKMQPPTWRMSLLVVQDPFLWQKNCAASVSVKKTDQWLWAVEKAYETLSNKADATLEDILVPVPPKPKPKPKQTPKKSAESYEPEEHYHTSSSVFQQVLDEQDEASTSWGEKVNAEAFKTRRR